MEVLQKRNFIKEYIKKQVVGPVNGEDEEINEEPRSYYISGVLFPINPENRNNEIFMSMEDGMDKGEDSDIAMAEQISTLSGKLFPSSMGILAYTESDSENVTIKVRYATYSSEENLWRRHPWELSLNVDELESSKKDIRLENAPGYLRIIKYIKNDKKRISVHMVNDGTLPENNGNRLSKAIYQPEIRIVCPDDSTFIDIRHGRAGKIPLEDKILYMQYRKYKVYATAYGCAAQWVINEKNLCTEVSTTFVPEHEVSPISFEVEGVGKVLNLKYLSHDLVSSRHGNVITELRNFLDKYRTWTGNLPQNNSDVGTDTEEFQAVIEYNEETVSRIEKGIGLLERDGVVREAFALTNLVMLMQLAHSRNIVKPEKDIKPWEDYAKLAEEFHWRPFQLAFLLLSIVPTADKKAYRDIVDLIWFPTGGGKTEAYLGLAAFTIILQRLRSPDKRHGTSVISRYTMRLLTSQQFERTSALICALELIRRYWPEKLGRDSISLGLWLGREMTPNTVDDAEKRFGILLGEDSPLQNNPFKLNNCPCCNSPLLPAVKSEDKEDYGYQLNDQRLEVKCLNHACPMTSGIPVIVVDEQIYNETPTIIIGTIDKFARLAWIEKAGWILNGKNGEYPPVSLIIQDELHLVSGPLGSLAGVYETAVESLCSGEDSKPHIIASAATVRRADEQCMALYGRHVRLFPTPGLDESDNFFSVKDNKRAGRTFMGVMAPHVSATTAAVRTHAILLQAPKEAEITEDTSDAYWTLVSYFNSVKELGVSTTLAADDIPDRLKELQRDPDVCRQITENDFTDLYSQKTGAELNDILARLEQAKDCENSLGLLLTTNIISVGIDVERLGLMLVNGQPKASSEYIQATSRVGRGIQMPGLIVTLYGATKPRDRSHYENFVSYHSTLYTCVEPSSVTPYSKPSRDRALHAAMVIMARNLSERLSGNEDARQIREHDTEVEQIKEIIMKRLAQVAPDEREDTVRELEFKFEKWYEWAGQVLYYDVRDHTVITSLLHREITPDDSKKGWRTLDSMRSVDYETRIVIEGDPTL